MSKIWAIARHTVAEGIRMKLALVFLGLVAVIVLGLPFSISGDSSMTGAVQAFMAYALGATGLLLGILTVFMSRSLSDELTGRQIFMVMTKPVPRWQYVLGKWMGVVLLNAAILFGSGLTIYGMVHYLKYTYPPQDPIFDKASLMNEVLVARHALKAQIPYDMFNRRAEQEFERNVEEGMYDNAPNLDLQKERARLARKYEAKWRVVGPDSMRVFEFENVLVDRSAQAGIQIRYKTQVTSAPPDEIYRGLWIAGDQAKGVGPVSQRVRHVVGRYHTVHFPASTVAKDNTLTVFFYNKNPYTPQEPAYHSIIEFRKSNEVEVLFVVGSFEGNFVRLLILMMCKLMFLAAVSILMVTVFSFPVACLCSFTVYVLATTRSFLMEALDFASDDYATMFSSVKEFLVQGISFIMYAIQSIIPDFSKYDGVEVFVNGQNVGLVWVLNGVFWLAIIQTGVVLGLAMLLFHRREVAEISV